jgi:hypothetical protein
MSKSENVCVCEEVESREERDVYLWELTSFSLAKLISCLLQEKKRNNLNIKPQITKKIKTNLRVFINLVFLNE